MESNEEMVAKAEAMSKQLEAEIAAITAEYNELIKQAGERAGVRLVTDVEIKILKRDEGQGEVING